MDLDEIVTRRLDELITRYPKISANRQDLGIIVSVIADQLDAGGKILTCGNGGSAADADHIVGELMKGFLRKRPLSDEQKNALAFVDPEVGRFMGEELQQGIPAISLCGATALNTAFSNDVDPSFVYAQQLMGLGVKGDLLWCLSTSGNSRNVVAAAIAAKSRGIVSIAMTGKTESRLSDLCDYCIRVQESETYKVQELHLPIYHSICLILEEYFFN